RRIANPPRRISQFEHSRVRAERKARRARLRKRFHRRSKSVRSCAQGARRNGTQSVASRASGNETLSRHIACRGVGFRRANMLWSYTKREQGPGDTAQQRPLKHLHEERCLRPSAFQRRADDVVLQYYLQALGEACGKFAPSLDLLECFDRNRSTPQRLRKD